MKKIHRLKAILASLLVTVALAAPAAVLSSNAPEVEAELHFSGVSLEMLPDGSVQALFEVSVDKAINCDGASFRLDYNPEYFTPSYMSSGADHGKNEAYAENTDPYDDGFFAHDPALYKPDISPFSEMPEVAGSTNSSYSVVTFVDHTISMELWLDQDVIKENGADGKIKPLSDVSLGGSMGSKLETVFVFNRKDENRSEDDDVAPERVTLGRLSFQVDPYRLDEVARYFPKPEEGKEVEPTEIAERVVSSGVTTYLIRTVEAGRWNLEDNWQIGVYKSNNPQSEPKSHKLYIGGVNDDVAKRYYELAVDPKQVMKVRPAEKDVVINAYQAFTNGDWGDVALALRAYSPMANVTYVDGTEENLVIPWGKKAIINGVDEYEYSVEVETSEGVWEPVDLEKDIPAYDPTHGRYKITQYIPGKSIHPLSSYVTLTVTPITLMEVQVENQIRTYNLNEVVSLVKTPSQLSLPSQARLVTDIVPGGVSMVMKIPGWTPEKGKWPIADESNALTLMQDLKEDSFGTGTRPADIPEFDENTMPYWPSEADQTHITNIVNTGAYWRFMKQKKGNWIGEYTFHLAESLGGDRKDGFTKTEIQEAFPWLTVPEEKYAVPDPQRRIVTADNYTNALEYKAEYVSTEVAANEQPELTLSVSRVDGTGMETGSIFRVWLPNGQELGTGLVETVWPDDEPTKIPDWFPTDAETGAKNGKYETVGQGEAGNRNFHLITNPGDPTKGEEGNNRETLRRYINLGGWYYVSVCEEPNNRTWSDPMPVYVPPRPNEYLETKEYNFVGENTELFHWAGDLTHYVTMPRGVYTAVTQNGVRLYDVEGTGMTLTQIAANPALKEAYLTDSGFPKETTLRYEERYGYTTTYDGSTGAQPGTLYSFRVGPDGTPPGEVWTGVKEDFKTDATALPAGAEIYRYGAERFYNKAVYPSYGTVIQPTAQTKTVTIRRDAVYLKTGNERITLTSAEPTGITRVDNNDIDSNVTLATYDTRTVGYTDRQEYTFKITNVGTTPIYGLAIDGLTDGYADDPTGGRFELLQAPADFLAPGQSTTFVLTYIYNLEHNGAVSTEQIPEIYRDTLYITSSAHPYGGKNRTNQDTPDTGGSYDYLLDFDAQFTVTDKDTHTVTVVVYPDDLSMGSAGLIMGRQSDNTMNYTVTARTYAENSDVYVAVYMKDEYKLVPDITNPSCVDAVGTEIPVNEITAESGLELQEGIRVFHFVMPDYDTVVYIRFYEDVLSKLRLSDLIDFSAGDKADLKENTGDTVAEENTYTVWRKTFTAEERAAAAKWKLDHGAQNPEEDLYLMTAGTTVRKSEGGNQFIPSENQYIVVIPYEADWSQVEAKLRQLETHSDYLGQESSKDIKPDVVMHHYGVDILDTWDTTVDQKDQIYQGTGDTSVPTAHTSDIFPSPKPGTSNYVRITISDQDTTRQYYLEIHRAPETPVATLHYGNSPYGMIMNDDLFLRDTEEATLRAQEAAKRAFRDNNYSFNGLLPSNTPFLVRTEDSPAVSKEAVYWREAWVRNTRLFEPESLTGFVTTFEPDPDNPNRRIPTTVPDPTVYVEEENMDLNDYSFFAILGENMKEPGVIEALDSTGRPVNLEDIHVRAAVKLLDTEAETQIGRFSGQAEAVLDLGIAGHELRGLLEPAVENEAKVGTWPICTVTETDPESGEETTAYKQVEHIRPGQYVLEYVYEDYNGEPLTVTRPLVILSAVGDVNSSGGRLDEKDETALKNRVTDPLGYVAGRWERGDGDEWEETVYPRANIFKYRVVDVNNDRNVNNIDGNLIRKIADGKAQPIRFYNPVTYVHKNT